MATVRNRCCRACKFHDVYWEGTAFAGCACRAWHEAESLARHHACGRSDAYEASWKSGTTCPRFTYFPPDDDAVGLHDEEG